MNDMLILEKCPVSNLFFLSKFLEKMVLHQSAYWQFHSSSSDSQQTSSVNWFNQSLSTHHPRCLHCFWHHWPFHSSKPISSFSIVNKAVTSFSAYLFSRLFSSTFCFTDLLCSSGSFLGPVLFILYMSFLCLNHFTSHIICTWMTLNSKIVKHLTRYRCCCPPHPPTIKT